MFFKRISTDNCAILTAKNFLPPTICILPKGFNMQQFVILSIDGGGIPRSFCRKALGALRASSKLPAFNLIAGTSTGSIIASCMALKIDPSIIVSLYQASGSIIFPKNFSSARDSWKKQSKALMTTDA